MVEVRGWARQRALEDLVVELEGLRIRIPEAIYDGEAEEILLDAYEIIRTHAPSVSWPVKRPYSGLEARVKLLAKLAKALRIRMHRSGTPYITGTEYFIAKLDELIMEAKLAAGLHPYLPAGKGEFSING
ncbi:MAG: hypothetical protein F7C82_00620 [Desulfurococcales archaeon]|nr:hypothetical protein [Desulfurococcales archaeon]